MKLDGFEEIPVYIDPDLTEQIATLNRTCVTIYPRHKGAPVSIFDTEPVDSAAVTGYLLGEPACNSILSGSPLLSPELRSKYDDLSLNQSCVEHVDRAVSILNSFR